MRSFFNTKRLTIFSTTLIALAAAAVTAACFLLWGVPSPAAAPGSTDSALTPQELYAAATLDSVVAEESEIYPLVVLDKSDELTTWDESGERVLLVSWNRHPERYIAGSSFALEHGEIWTFTDREIAMWYKANKDGVTDWELRFEQLIGLPPDAGYTHFSGFYVDPEDVLRPAYQCDAASGDMYTELAQDDEAFSEWFDGNILWSYFKSQYPWTRLGYTYDWADNGTKYGLTEFIIKNGASAKVAFTYTTEEFIDWLAKQ